LPRASSAAFLLSAITSFACSAGTWAANTWAFGGFGFLVLHRGLALVGAHLDAEVGADDRCDNATGGAGDGRGDFGALDQCDDCDHTDYQHAGANRDETADRLDLVAPVVAAAACRFERLGRRP